VAPDLRDPTLFHPTAAGLLLFGQAPQEIILQAEVICVLFGDPLGLRRYLDRRILHGTLSEQIDQAEGFFKRHMRVGARMEGFHRVDEPDYPLAALREAVVNAVVHRDYSLSGEAVRLLYYPDRIEVHSPGLLLPGIRLDDLRAGRVPSRPRNPLLVTLLRDLPGNYMERMGTGISYMMDEMAALGRPTPEFVEQNEFLVTFRTESVRAAGPVSTPQSTAGASRHAQRAEDAGRLGTQEERWALALRYVQEHGAITNKGYRQVTGVSGMTALRDLEQLVARGSLRAEGQGRGRKYRP
jgi:ATP-dependent DNA helicase RecG